jgi:hypothetical protein
LGGESIDQTGQLARFTKAWKKKIFFQVLVVVQFFLEKPEEEKRLTIAASCDYKFA